MASNSTTPNEDGSGDDGNNSQEINKNPVTWKLLTNYIDRFVKECDEPVLRRRMLCRQQF